MPTSSGSKPPLDEKWQEYYFHLKVRHPSLYTRCVEASSALAFRHNLSLEAVADIEKTLVMIVLDALDEELP